ncbi:hypothetical protein SAMN05421493_10284 [Pseudobutyrivibrio sp. 49]|uniref:hypothetical protein n=1 Tax=Pseudobutyrivibrio sp. 49 TaxID=1855344 RepID=UPI00087F202D|nr:hypothetical protein [Pseudobutyrivibrio sp. 49]SDH59861.1 hypothetical protein SAMN05421493_10284 [Pseudobutyrivibrio sp. 49]
MINYLYWALVVFIVSILLNIKIVRKQIERVSKKNSIYICVAIIFVWSFIPVFVDYIRDDKPIYYGETGEIIKVPLDWEKVDTVGEIYDDVEIEQSFYCASPLISSIGVMVNNYGRDNNGTLKVELYDKDTEELLDYWDINLDKITETDYIKLSIHRMTGLEGFERTYIIRIFSNDSVKGNAVTVLQTSDRIDNAELKINGKETDKNLVFYVLGSSFIKESESIRIWIALVICVGACFIYRKIGGEDGRFNREFESE